MKKIISLFQRNYDGDHLVRNEVVPGAEWVLAGEGVATVKWDGTCCMVRNKRLYKRYDARRGKKPPEGFEPAQEPDEKTGHWPGWIPVGHGPEDRWHREAAARTVGVACVSDRIVEVAESWEDGTYELIGPAINANPHKCVRHELVRHGAEALDKFPRTFDEIKALFAQPWWEYEGVVWHHPDGRMVKIKKRDFFR